MNNYIFLLLISAILEIGLGKPLFYFFNHKSSEFNPYKSRFPVFRPLSHHQDFHKPFEDEKHDDSMESFEDDDNDDQLSQISESLKTITEILELLVQRVSQGFAAQKFEQTQGPLQVTHSQNIPQNQYIPEKTGLTQISQSQKVSQSSGSTVSLSAKVPQNPVSTQVSHSHLVPPTLESTHSQSQKAPPNLESTLLSLYKKIPHSPGYTLVSPSQAIPQSPGKTLAEKSENVPIIPGNSVVSQSQNVLKSPGTTVFLESQKIPGSPGIIPYIEPLNVPDNLGPFIRTEQIQGTPGITLVSQSYKTMKAPDSSKSSHLLNVPGSEQTSADLPEEEYCASLFDKLRFADADWSIPAKYPLGSRVTITCKDGFRTQDKRRTQVIVCEKDTLKRRNSWTTVDPCEAMCPPPFHMLGGICIFNDERKRSWKEAKGFCAGMNPKLGSKIAMFQTSDKLKDFRTYLNIEEIKKDELSPKWIGLRDANKEGRFSWDDGSPLAFDPQHNFVWNQGKPRTGLSSEDCVHIVSGGLSDADCDAKYSSFCEIPL